MCPGSEIAVWLSKLYELGRFGLLREIMTVFCDDFRFQIMDVNHNTNQQI